MSNFGVGFDNGMLFMDYVVTLLLFVAAVLNMAVLRDVYIPEPLPIQAGRRIIAGGYTLLLLWFLFLFYKAGQLPISFIGGLGLGMLSMGSILVNATRLHRRWNVQHGYSGPERRDGRDRRHCPTMVGGDRRHQMTATDWDTVGE